MWGSYYITTPLPHLKYITSLKPTVIVLMGVAYTDQQHFECIDYLSKQVSWACHWFGEAHMFESGVCRWNNLMYLSNVHLLKETKKQFYTCTSSSLSVFISPLFISFACLHERVVSICRMLLCGRCESNSQRGLCRSRRDMLCTHSAFVYPVIWRLIWSSALPWPLPISPLRKHHIKMILLWLLICRLL